MEQSSVPVGVLVDRSTARLYIEWRDGHISTFEFAFLLERCPCSPCREGGTPPSEPEEARVASVRMAGSQALLIAFEGGHDEGAYSFEYLRSVCSRAAEGLKSATG